MHQPRTFALNSSSDVSAYIEEALIMMQAPFKLLQLTAESLPCDLKKWQAYLCHDANPQS